MVTVPTTTRAAGVVTLSLSTSTPTVDEFAGTATVTVTADAAGGGNLDSDITATVVALPASTATEGASDDFTLSGTAISFGLADPTGSTQDVTVTLNDDGDLEDAEFIRFGLTAITGGALDGGTLDMTITDDDTATVSFASGSSGVTEGSSPHQVTVELTWVGGGTLPTDVVVDVGQTPNTAVTPGDYTLVTTQVTFSSGSSSGATQTVDVTIADDGVHEATTENFALDVSVNSGPAVVGGFTSHTVTITDDDDVTIRWRAPASSSFAEGSGLQQIVAEVVVPGGGTVQSAVSATVGVGGGGSATEGAGNDYTLDEFSVSFGVGVADGTARLIDVTVLGDALIEGDETANITLSSPVGRAVLGTATHVVTITDDDTAGVTVDDGGGVAVTEGGATDSFTIVLDAEPDSSVTIDIDPGTQVTTSATQVVFTPGNWDTVRTITVTAVDDGLFEGAHAGTVSFSVSSSDTNFDGLPVGDVTPSITDDDAVVISGPTTAAEGDPLTFTASGWDVQGDESYDWQVDGVPTGTGITFDYTPMDDGVFVISLTVTDASAGTGTDPDDHTLTVSNVAPTIALSGSGPVDEGSVFTLSIGAVTDPGDDTPTGYTIDWGDGSGPEPVAATPGDITHTYVDGPSAPTIEVSVTDEDGTFLAGTLGVSVVNVAPTISAPTTATITEGDTLTTSISFSDPGVDTHEATIDYGEGAGPGAPTVVTSPFDLSNLYEDDGLYTVTIDIEDSDGAIDTVTIDVTVDNAPPVVTARADANVDEGTEVFIGGGGGTSFTDVGVGDTHTATVDWGEGGGPVAATVTGSNGSFNISGASNTYDTPGVFTVTIEVTDDADALSVGTDTFTVNVQNTNLTVDADPDGSDTVDEGDTVSITADFDDNDGTGSYSATIDWGDGTVDDCSTAACTLSGGGGGIGTVTGSHTYPQDGSFTVTVTVDDGGIDVGAGGFTYTVQNVVPSTNVTGPATSDEGTQIQLRGNPSDPGADTLTYSWTITKNGDFFKSGTFRNVNVRPDDNGTYEAQYIVFDDDGQSATDIFTWTVLNLNPTAEIIDADTGDPVTGIAEIGEEGSTITLGADVDDPSSVDTFTYDWTISQPGSDPITGTNPTISFVSPDDGLFFVSLTVTDDDGGSFSPSAPIISVNNADPIIENLVTDPTPAVGATVSLGIFFSDPGELDTHSMTVDWGDGDTDSISSATSPETLTHSYGSAGPRQAEVCITDDDGGTSCATWWYNVGGSLSTFVDYNGDGRGDLAVGVPGEDDGAGAVHVLYGRASGLSGINDQFLRQGIGGVKGSQAAGDAFGSALAHGDFNGDGYTDLAIGAPGDDQSGKSNSGNVTVIYGSASGLDLGTDQVWHQNRNGVDDSAEAGDGFGEAMVAGDFNGDAYADLAIAAPFENVDGKVDTGRVFVLFGSPTGIRGSGSQALDQNVGEIKNSNADNDHYGAALSAGDFDGDGFVDLAVGVPGQKVNAVNRVGAVNVLFGTTIGLAESGDLFLRRGQGGLGGTADENDEFGSVLAAGDLTGDGFDDLVAGVPNDAIGAKAGAGTVLVIPGSGSGPSGANDVQFREGSNGIAGNPAKQDGFGSSLAVGDSNNDGYDDLLIGIPNQKVNGERQAGTAAYIPGSPTLDGAGDSRWHEDRNNVLGVSERADHLGTAVALIDVNGNGRADLLIGIPDQNSDSNKKDVGAVLLIRGGTKKPVTKNNQYLWQGVDGLSDGQQKFDRFGAAF